MPITRRMRSPASDSRSGRMSGMPPPTDASKRMSTPAPSAVSNSSRPWVAMSSLLAVTTGLPPLSASTMRPRAGSVPPQERFDEEATGGLEAADDLDHDVDVGIAHDRGGIVGEASRRERQVALL